MIFSSVPNIHYTHHIVPCVDRLSVKLTKQTCHLLNEIQVLFKILLKNFHKSSVKLRKR